jgi:hypothetical protein
MAGPIDVPALMRASTILSSEPATRRVYFSFHYKRDIIRVQQVKNHWVVGHDNHRAAGYFDGSLEEKSKKDGEAAIKRLINGGLFGCSVTCVLIGAETFTRDWVHYEIFKSIETGMGVFGVRIHSLSSFGKVDPIGPTPFECLGYGTKPGSDRIVPMVHRTTGWHDAQLNESVARSEAKAVKGFERPMLSTLFEVYDWDGDDGRSNFSRWVGAAARQAGRA